MSGNIIFVGQDVTVNVESAVVDDVDVVASNVGFERREIVGVVVAERAKPVRVGQVGSAALG